MRLGSQDFNSNVFLSSEPSPSLGCAQIRRHQRVQRCNWHNIAQVLRTRIAEGFRPVVVHSALSGITDRLESLLATAMTGTHAPVLEHIDAAHRELAERLSIVPNPQFEAFMRELRDMAASLAERRKIDDAMRARVMAMGELLSTTLGAEFVNAQGISTAGWTRAGCCVPMTAIMRPTRPACCRRPVTFPRLEIASRLACAQSSGAHPRFHRGKCGGDTVLLGRGGSDTSSAYVAAKLQAARLEIWTDVPVCSAPILGGAHRAAAAPAALR